jgi:hypothetical protein
MSYRKEIADAKAKVSKKKSTEVVQEEEVILNDIENAPEPNKPLVNPVKEEVKKEGVKKEVPKVEEKKEEVKKEKVKAETKLPNQDQNAKLN